MTDDIRARPTGRAGGADAPEPAAQSQPDVAYPSRGQRYRHVKRGTIYEVVGVAELQMNFDLLVDGSAMVIYRGEDERLWAREESEFVDGRFEPLGDAPQSRSVVDRCIHVLRGSLLAGAGPEARAQRDADIAILETLL